jgi:YD repeat-containing protein
MRHIVPPDSRVARLSVSFVAATAAIAVIAGSLALLGLGESRTARVALAAGGSGPYAPGPLNHTFDGTPRDSDGRIFNFDFEEGSSELGTPPSNYDFASGLSNWTVGGAVTVTSSGCASGDCARIGNGAGELISSLFTVDDDAQVVTFQYTNNTAFSAHILDSNDQVLETRSFLTSQSSLAEGAINVVDYQGNSVKFRVYSSGGGYVHIDDAGVMRELMPGWQVHDEPRLENRGTGGSPNYYAEITSSTHGQIISSAFLVPSDAQFLRHDIYFAASGHKFRITLLPEPGASCVAKTFDLYEGSGGLSVGWNDDHKVDVSSCQGDSIRVRYTYLVGTTGVDNVARLYQTVPHWKTTSPANFEQKTATPMLGSYVEQTTAGTSKFLESAPFDLPSDAGILQFWHSQNSNANLQVHVLFGPDFGSTSSALLNICCQRAWQVRQVDVSPWAGEPIKLRFTINKVVRLDEVGFNLWERYHGQCANQCMAADPVSTSTGNFSLARADLRTPALGEDLDFVRAYNATATVSGTLGYRWMHNWEIGLAIESGGSVTVRYPDGSSNRFKYVSGSYEAEDDVHDTLTKSGSEYTLTTSVQMRYKFNSSGQLTSTLDRNGNTTTVAYSAGKLSSVTAPDGRQLQFTYSGALLTRVEAPLKGVEERVVEFEYDTGGTMNLLSAVTDTLGHRWEYTYDEERLVSESDPRSHNVFTNEYDTANRVETQTDAEGGVHEFQYGSPSDGFTTVVDPRGTSTRYEFDSNMHTLTQTVDAGGLALARAWEYDGESNTEWVTNALGIGTHLLHYSDSANLKRKTDGIGRVWTYGYNSWNEVVTATLPNGRQLSNGYNGTGNLISTTEVITHPSYPTTLTLRTAQVVSPTTGLTTLVTGTRGFTTATDTTRTGSPGARVRRDDVPAGSLGGRHGRLGVQRRWVAGQELGWARPSDAIRSRRRWPGADRDQRHR